ncbi:MAG: T9SS C-terminal target domain-containing protein [Bacteroidota bacterium]
MRYLWIILLLLKYSSTFAQFPTDEGISPIDPTIIGWGQTPTIERGPQQTDSLQLGLADVGTPEDAAGPADLVVVSLGEEGTATYAFDPALENGPGWDVAVFENGFASGNGFFLELAFLEISSDGENFFRFPNASLTDTTTQLGTFGLIQQDNLDGLAGKYEGQSGTPFDFSILESEPDLDVSAITHVRIIDIIGRVNQPTFDSENRPINDPWPTPFPSSGFDLDAIAIRYQGPSSTHVVEDLSKEIAIYPNPLRPLQNFSILGLEELDLNNYTYRWLTPDGRTTVQHSSNDRTAPQNAGLYILEVRENSHSSRIVARTKVIVR